MDRIIKHHIDKCAVCGRDAGKLVTIGTNEKLYQVRCGKCKAHTPTASQRHEAVKSWNSGSVFS